ncbi:hypothetical protein CB473P2_00111 [Enterocloster phage CB473P2]|nr:hypothetical protein CB457P2_00111 [Enterocloster phage CB457P2]WAX11398.1 hypothetical protein CB473P1_00111 [Enterocloster phage CB473P1]WAX11531.1 hypothetical protein CB473P2_00111 [Enterocloster phage CB473P2]
MRKTNIWRKDITISSNWLQKRLLAEIRKDLRVVCILSENGRKIGEEMSITNEKCRIYLHNFYTISNLLLELQLISAKNRKLLDDIAQRSLKTVNVTYIYMQKI